MKSKKLAYNKILVLFCIIVVSVLMTGCDDEPIVLFFFADPSTINQGESSTLFWGVAKATSVTITPDVGTVTPSGFEDVSPGVNTEYTLIATNSAGSVSATFTIYLNPVQYPVYNATKSGYYKTIQAALNDADYDNTIVVADGTYDENIFFPSGMKIILLSKNGPSSTAIRGDDIIYTVNLDNSPPGTTIEGFTITHAVGLIGGGISNDVGSNLIIDNCTISGNTAYYGGGIHNEGTLAITGENTISGNSAIYDGGGIHNDGGTLTIEGKSTISGNTADSGGGIDNFGTLAITGDEITISGNSAVYDGGGIRNYGTLTIVNYSTGILTITASIISGNTADRYGGGIYIWGTDTTIIASTISGNDAGDNGGGIYIEMCQYYDCGYPTIGGYISAKKNLICGNYKSGNSPSLDQQIRGDSEDLYDSYKDTNYIYTNCP